MCTDCIARAPLSWLGLLRLHERCWVDLALPGVVDDHVFEVVQVPTSLHSGWDCIISCGMGSVLCKASLLAALVRMLKKNVSK